MSDDTPLEITRGFQFGLVDAAVIRDPSLNPSTKLAYAVIATYADKDRSAFPTRATIAKAMACSTDTVDRALKALVATGWVVVLERHAQAGGQRSSLYTLNDLGSNRGAASVNTPAAPVTPQGAAPMRRGGAAPMRPISVPGSNNTTMTNTTQEPSVADAPTGDLFDGLTLVSQGQQQPGENPDFTNWYENVYPRKRARKDAAKAYAKAVKEGATPAFLLAAVQAFQFSTDPTKIPHPSTWLNGKRWQDTPDQATGGIRVKTDREWGISTKAELDANGGW